MKKILSAAAEITGIAVAVSAGAGFLVFNEIMNRNANLAGKLGKFFVGESGLEEPSEPDPRAVWFSQREFKEYSITNKDGQRLKGYFYPAETESDVYVFAAHGYRSSGRGDYSLLTKYYHDKGFNVFLVDHRASGESEGKYIGFGYHEYADSLLWLDFMKAEFGNDIRIILHGISMGCATVTMMSRNDILPENVKFIVADCGYTSAYDEFKHNIKNMKLPEFPVLTVSNLFNKAISGYDFKAASPIDAVKTAKVPMLFIHGSKDNFVPVKMVYELYDACTSDYKDMLIVEGAGHAESYPKNSEAYENKLNEFIERYIK